MTHWLGSPEFGQGGRPNLRRVRDPIRADLGQGRAEVGRNQTTLFVRVGAGVEQIRASAVFAEFHRIWATPTKFGPIPAGVGAVSAHVRPCRQSLERIRSTVGPTCRPNLCVSTKAGPMHWDTKSARLRPNSAKCGHIPSKFGQTFAAFAQNGPNLGQINPIYQLWQSPAKFRQHLTNAWPSSRKFGPNSTDFGRRSTTFGPPSPKFGDLVLPSAVESSFPLWSPPACGAKSN